MKKTITLMMLMILLTSISLTAQTTVGLTAGPVFSNVKAKAQGISISPKGNTGITFGLFTNFALSPNFSFQPAINYVQKGFMEKDGTSKDKVKYNYIEVPLNFVYNNTGFFVGIGPSVGFGLSGKDKFTDSGDPSSSETTDIKFGSADTAIKRVEFGANALVGYKFSNGFLVSVNYNLGLSNLANGNASETGTIKNRYFALKIGYVFGGKKKK